MDDRISIILTERRRLSCVRLVLGGLLKNSRYKDHEIVFVGDRIWEPCEGSFEVEGYSTIEEYLNSYWIPKLETAGFRFRLITGNWTREKVDSLTWNKPVGLTPCYECWSHGVDNAKNEWIMILGSDDYMGPDWDVNIIKRFPSYSHLSHVFQPVFAFISRPRGDPTLRGETPDDHYGRPGWKALYVSYEDQEKKPLRESVVHEHWKTSMVNDVFLEQGGERRMLGYWATVVHMDVIDRIRPLNPNHQIYDWRHVQDQYEFNAIENGSLDLDFDTKLHHVGAMKVGCLDSFFYNLKHYRQNPKGPNHNFIFDSGEP